MDISITVLLLLICVVVSYLCFKDSMLFNKLKHWPYGVIHHKEYYRLISSGFVHGSWIHLLINMFVFWQFGEIVELYYQQIFGPVLGRVFYLLLFLITIVFADMSTLYKHRDNPNYAAVGASGAVSGIVFVYILFEPWNMLYLYMVIPIPGFVAGIAYLAYSSWAAKNSRDNVDHDAHFYGALFGIIFTILLKPSLAIHFWNRLIELPF